MPVPQRRSTDKVEVVDERIDGTYGLLSERISALREAITEKILGHWRLDDERWLAHQALHQAAEEANQRALVELAASLREYKAASNEWRQTLNDLRNQTLTRAEFEAKHGALEAAIESAQNALEGKIAAVNDRLSEKIEPLKDARISGEVERRTTRTVFSDLRGAIILGSTIIGLLLAAATYFAAHP